MKILPGLSLLLLITSLFIAGCKIPSNTKEYACSATDTAIVVSPLVFIEKLPGEVMETSGLMIYDSLIWTINDSGGENVVYGLNMQSGKIERRIRIKNAVNHDWEAMARDSAYVYIADAGNNHGTRSDLCIYKIDLSAFDSAYKEVEAEVIYFSWPGQKSFIKATNSNPWDCEAMLSYGDSLVLFSKDWVNQTSRMYVISKEAGDQAAVYHSGCDVGVLVTGADLSPDKKSMVLSAYSDYDPYLLLFENFEGINFFSGSVRKFIYPAFHDTQTEGICFTGNDTLLISAEKSRSFKQAVYIFSLSSLDL